MVASNSEKTDPPPYWAVSVRIDPACRRVRAGIYPRARALGQRILASDGTVLKSDLHIARVN